jgi:hypothetical protein
VFNGDDDTAFELDATSVEPRDETILEIGAIPVELIKDKVVAASEFDGDEASAVKLEGAPTAPKDDACELLADCEFENAGEK